MKWFERHLNYTVLLSVNASILLFVMFVFLLAEIEPYMPKPITDVFGGLAIIIYIGLPLFVAGWALRQKRKSLKY